MKKMNTLLALVLLAAVTFTACGKKGGGSPAPVDPRSQDQLVTRLSGSPIVSFTQSVVSQDSADVNNEVFPGQANVWALDQDFALVDGFDNQFDYALSITVGATAFPSDQVYSELTFTGPLMGAADGVKVAAVSDGKSVGLASDKSIGLVSPGAATAVVGTYAAFLNATSDSRLQQTLDLTSARAPLTVDWREAVSLEMGNIPGYDPSYRIVVRSADGTLLKELHADPSVIGPTNHSEDLGKYAGQTVVLSFEVRSSTFSFSQAYAIIDSVSVRDADKKEYLTNGNFETGDLTGWATNAPSESQNVVSGVRTVEGLDVTRSFYTVPNKLWGRWVDVYENPTAAAITKTVTYETSLGSDGAGIIYYAPGTGNRALTSWDSLTGDRDLGLVFGNAREVFFTSDDKTGFVGSKIIRVVYDVSVPAGGRVAVVNFVIMNGTDTGLTALDAAVKAVEIDDEAARIVSGFWTDPQYRAGMTQAQIDAVSNFANTP